MESTVTYCWNQIGVAGDGSCVQLKTVVHCRNCPVYVAAGRTLLQRESPLGYVEEWTNLLAQDWQEKVSSVSEGDFPLQQKVSAAADTLSLMVFRIGEEWLALPVWVVKEVTQPCSIHSLPHRTNHVFLGIVNIRGEILMCISLSSLLNLSTGDFQSQSMQPRNTINPVVYQRMVVIEIQSNRWVFPVDEISGVQRFSSQDLGHIPVVISKTPDTYTKNIITWQDKKVSYLDYELLFYELLFYTLNRT